MIEDPELIDIYGWLDRTRPNLKSLAPEQKEFFITMRNRVFDKSGANLNSLAVFRHRGKISERMYNAVKDATQSEPERYRINVEFKDFDQKPKNKGYVTDTAKTLRAVTKARDSMNELIESLSSL